MKFACAFEIVENQRATDCGWGQVEQVFNLQILRAELRLLINVVEILAGSSYCVNMIL